MAYRTLRYSISDFYTPSFEEYRVGTFAKLNRNAPRIAEDRHVELGIIKTELLNLRAGLDESVGIALHVLRNESDVKSHRIHLCVIGCFWSLAGTVYLKTHNSGIVENKSAAGLRTAETEIMTPPVDKLIGF